MTKMSAIDHRVGTPTFAINLLIRPPSAVLSALSHYQDQLAQSIPGNALFRCRSDTLHLSVFQFVWARADAGDLARVAWEKSQEEVLSRLTAVTGSAPTFPVGAPCLKVHESAVILQFEPAPALEALRDEVAGIAQHLANSRRPAIQHISLFRFHQEVALPELELAMRRVPLPALEWEVTELQVVQESVYPSLEEISLARIKLRQSLG